MRGERGKHASSLVRQSKTLYIVKYYCNLKVFYFNVLIRDAIFLANSDFRFFGSVTCRYRFLPILIPIYKLYLTANTNKNICQFQLKMIYIIK